MIKFIMKSDENVLMLVAGDYEHRASDPGGEDGQLKILRPDNDT